MTDASEDVSTRPLYLLVIVDQHSLHQKSLLECLDLLQLNCLNESSKHSLHGIVSSKQRNSTDAFLLSDADEQLLLNIHVGIISPDL